MEKIISIKNLVYQIPYSDVILEDLNFEVKEKEFLGILGHNGSGKTTLLDLLMGFRGITKGEMHVLGEDPHGLFRKHKDQVVFLSQDVSIKGNISIAQYLNFQSTFYSHYSKEDEKQLLRTFQLSPESKVGALSLGQQKKVQIISGLAARPKLILIDEITAVLDPETREIFFNELEKARQRLSCAIVLATNIAEDLVERADKVLFVTGKKGTLHEPQEILKLFNLEEAA